MKQTSIIQKVALILSVVLLSSCISGGGKTQVTIYDGELEWPSIANSQVMQAIDENGMPAMWFLFLQTEVGNSLRSLSLSVFTCEPGSYSGLFDAANDKWTNPAIGSIILNVDYDGIPYPTWNGQSAVVTIHRFDKKAKSIDATVEAVVMKEGTTELRNIKVDIKNLVLRGQ